MSPKGGISIICIEGGIGVGKSTALAKLKEERPDLVFVDEPVDAWERAGLLQGMYEGKLSHAVFQQQALMSRAGLLLEAIQKGAHVIVTERSPWSDRAVFAEANLTNRLEKKAYNLTFDFLMRALPKTVNLHLIYLSASVEELAKRIERRGREAEEEGVAKMGSTAYLKRLNTLHEELWNSSLVCDEFSTRTRIDTTAMSPFHVQQTVLDTIRRIAGECWLTPKRARDEDEAAAVWARARTADQLQAVLAATNLQIAQLEDRIGGRDDPLEWPEPSVGQALLEGLARKRRSRVEIEKELLSCPRTSTNPSTYGEVQE